MNSKIYTSSKNLRDDPVITARQYLKYRKLLKEVPDSFIITSPSAMLQLIKFYKIKKAGRIIRNDIFIIKINGIEIGVLCPSYGAPTVAMVMEEAIALGAKNFILVEAAGALQHKLKAGSIVIPTKTVREDGTSFHYTKPSRYAIPNSNLNNLAESALKKNKIEYSKGITWTIDILYRETKEKVRHHIQEGVLCVDMDATALLTVAEYYNLSATALFYITDSLTDLKWKPYFFSDESKKGQILLLKSAIDTFCMMKNPSFKIQPLKKSKVVVFTNLLRLRSAILKL